MCAPIDPKRQGMTYAAMAADGLFPMGWTFQSWQAGEEFVVQAHKGERKIVVLAPSPEVAMMETERQAKEIEVGMAGPPA